MQDVLIHITNNQVTNRKALENFFNEIKKKDGKYLITVKSIKRRSCSQNKFLHGVVIPMVYEGLKGAGFDEVRDHEDAKMIIKDLFLRRTIKNEKTNTSITVIRKTSELTTVEFNDFIERVSQWCAEYLGFALPMPNEQVALFAH